MSERDVFIAALQKDDPAERQAYLDEACAGQPVLREQVEELLRLHQNAGSFLEQPAPAEGVTGAVAPDQWIDPANPLRLTEGPGSRIGPYKLLQQIGEGGMGVVYMAEQEQPVRRKVALKIIKPGMDSAQVLARFEAERQALALMDHQNIARVLDVGATASGRPYFVMELVKGVPITKFCDDNHLTPRERLELFVPVCQAIQHAHQKGIIHRDIKPSNVLVTLYDGKPVPKVIDFGVAKAIEQRLTERTLFTQFGQVVGTLEYMSPEQAELSALDIDTRSDIYSLGVLLYELLTGSTPLEQQKLRSVAFTEMLRMIREQEPPKPSTRLSASGEKLPSISAQRKTEPAKLAKLVRGELDWIVMKALEKDRGRRYETANGFAREIQRYLADEPVEACPPSAAYKLRKFARKNRRVLATADAFVLLLVAAATVSTWQAIRATRAETKARKALALAEERFDLAKEAVDKYLNEVTETQELKGANFHDLRKKLLETALPFYQKLAEQAPGDPEREAARGRAYGRLGDIRLEMGEYFLEFGEATAGLADYRAMHAIFDRLAEAFPAESDYRREASRSLIGQGLLSRRIGRPADAEAAYRAALAVGQQLVNDFPSIPAYRSDLAKSHNRLAEVLAWDRGRKLAEAEDEARAALKEQQRLADEHPNNLDYRHELAKSHNNLGTFLRAQRKWAESWDEYRVALEQQRRLAAEYPNVPKYRHFLAMTHQNLGQFLAARDGRAEEAEAKYRAALKELRRLVGEHPNVPEYREHLVESLSLLIELLAQQGKHVEAEGECREAIRLNPDDHKTHGILGYVLAQQGKRADAEVEFRAALKDAQRLADARPNNPDYRNGLANIHINLGLLLGQQGKRADAEVEFRAALAIAQKLVSEHPNLPHYRRDSLDRSLKALVALLAQRGDRQALLALAERFKAGVREPQVDLYYAACLVSNCINLVQKDTRLPEARRKELARTYAEQAMDLLGRAVQAGYGNSAGMRRDADLQPLRGRQDFQKLLADVQTAQVALQEKKVAADPKNTQFRANLAASHHNLGHMLDDLGKLVEAEAEFRAAIKDQQSLAGAHPNNTDYRRELAGSHNCLGALLHNRLGKLDEAIVEYREALALDPKEAAVHNNLGNALRDKHDLDGAIACHKKALELDPKVAPAHNNLGATLEDRGRLDEAIAEYREALALDPKEAAVHSNLGNALGAKGDLDGAIACYQKALELDPKFAYAHNGLGNALRDKGDLDGAIAEYREALRLKKDYALAQSNLNYTLAERDALVKLPAILSGKAKAADTAEQLTVARLCLQPYKRLYAAAARFYGEAFADKPQLAGDMAVQHRYNAACAAALAGCGQGKDVDKLDAKQLARLRQQSLDWLRDDLKAYRQMLDKTPDTAGPQVADRMRHWLQDTDFAGVRGPEALARLPEAERPPWQKLWEEVEALRQFAAAKQRAASPTRH
jgi:serine/threonine protein kinase/tetratricopeptide (TPR) repeat protein